MKCSKSKNGPDSSVFQKVEVHRNVCFFSLLFLLLPRAEIAKNVPNATTTQTTINFERKLRQVKLKVKPTNEDEAGIAWETFVHGTYG